MKFIPTNQSLELLEQLFLLELYILITPVYHSQSAYSKALGDHSGHREAKEPKTSFGITFLSFLIILKSNTFPRHERGQEYTWAN